MEQTQRRGRELGQVWRGLEGPEQVWWGLGQLRGIHDSHTRQTRPPVCPTRCDRRPHARHLVAHWVQSHCHSYCPRSPACVAPARRRRRSPRPPCWCWWLWWSCGGGRGGGARMGRWGQHPELPPPRTLQTGDTRPLPRAPPPPRTPHPETTTQYRISMIRYTNSIHYNTHTNF